MNLHRISILVPALICSITITGAVAAHKKDEMAKEAEVAFLRMSLELMRDSLQNDIAGRWQAKQRSVEQRETDKEELSRLKDVQERAYSDLARMKEECLSKEKNAEEAAAALAREKETERQCAVSFDEMLTKEAESIIDGFPLDFETRRHDEESLRREFTSRQDSYASLGRFMEYKLKYLDLACRLQIVKQTVLSDAEGSKLLTIARFGSVFAYGMSEAGEFYFIRQSGRLGADKYRIERIESSLIQASLLQLFPTWVASGRVSGIVLSDVLQNDQTKALVAGKKSTEYRKFIMSIKAGGAVMVPLLLLPIWAIALILVKLVQFGRKRGMYFRQYKKVVSYLEKNDSAQALSYAASCKGAVARIFEVCLKNPGARRDAMEKAVREIFVVEIPRLNTYLNTLAVIAGAAPLLGLLGTISGMISLFAAVTHYGTGDPKFLAGGISEALITAKTGLVVAIPVLFIHDFLRNTKDRLQADMEKYALRILNMLRPGID